MVELNALRYNAKYPALGSKAARQNYKAERVGEESNG
jgi:hypothetical protein